MSRLTDLIRQVQARDPQLAADLTAEVEALRRRRAFGLDFERHLPEAVELPRRAVRAGDKVRVLPERGGAAKGDPRLWRVTRVERGEGAPVGLLTLIYAHDPETKAVPLGDLVVVAELGDPIHPGLKSTGRVERGGDKPFHAVINAENDHALQALLFSHEGAVDCIYIDPPYNTRDRGWKYNNDYVDRDDAYPHSKWLSMMERRLLLARRLLDPDDSVLVVTIDENECLRLGLLLEQIFPGAHLQMVTSVISAKGAVRPGQFSRVEEYIFFVTLGAARLCHWTRNMLDEDPPSAAAARVAWLGLRRREPSSVRGARPNQFYPIFVDAREGRLHSIGDPLADGVDRRRVRAPEGTVALWPLRPDGAEMLWGLTPQPLRDIWEQGFARVHHWNAKKAHGTVQYLPRGTISRIRDGSIAVTGRAPDGEVLGAPAAARAPTPPKRVWNLPSHNAETGGTNLLSALLPGRRFPYPKSLYAVEDTLRFFVGAKPEALIVDFFSGSGTTAHAVARLNKQDGGRRRSVSITNNEVSDAESRRLREQGLRPGDPGWERHGICEHITTPRIRAAVTGATPAGDPIEGEYKFTDEFPMADGFEENVEFFDLTYETPRRAAHHRSFPAVAPLLWLRAGAEGRRIQSVEGYDVADTYGVLVDLDQAPAFLEAISASDAVRMVFVVTDDDRRFQRVCADLPSRVAPVRIAESYLTSFAINAGRE